MIKSDEFHLIRKKILLYLFIKELHCIVGEYPGVPLKTILHLLLPVFVSPRCRVSSSLRRPLFVSQVSPSLPGTLFHCSKNRTCDRSLCTFTFILDGGGAKGKMGGAYWPSRGRSDRGHAGPRRETERDENIGANVSV